MTPVSIVTLFPLLVPPRHLLLAELREAHRVLACVPDAVPEVAAIGVRTEPLTDENGVFEAGAAHLGARVADAKLFPGLTLLHEVGHALDYCVLGAEQGWASEGANRTPAQTGAWTAFETAVRQSTTWQLLQAARREDLDTEILAAYLLKPKEVFARAFAQYAVSCALESPLNMDITRLAGRRPPQQWPEDDFAMLNHALQRVLQAYGGVT
ncbi:MAG: hypothetical protein AB1511_04145 [Deinococcota bacterium]